MKRILVIISCLFILANLNPTKAHAAIGDRCTCPEGRKWTSDRCVNVNGEKNYLNSTSFSSKSSCFSMISAFPGGIVVGNLFLNEPCTKFVQSLGMAGANAVISEKSVNFACTKLVSDLLAVSDIAEAILYGKESDAIDKWKAAGIKYCNTNINATINEMYGGAPKCTEGVCNHYGICANSDDDAPYDLCDQIEDESQKAKCASCIAGGGVLTALGCIKTDPKVFIGNFLTLAVGIAGGISLLLMVYGGFLISVSTGDPKKADEGKEIITGAIAGLLFIIFSVFLLKLIGVDILQIPGLK